MESRSGAGEASVTCMIALSFIRNEEFLKSDFEESEAIHRESNMRALEGKYFL